MDEKPRRSSPRPALRPGARRVVVPRRAACRPCRATARVPHRTAATRGSARATRDAPRSPPAWGLRARHRRQGRAGRGTVRTPRSGLARATLRRRGTPAAVAAKPGAAQRWSSWSHLYCRCRPRSRRQPALAGCPGCAYQRLVGRVDLIAMLGPWEHTLTHVARVIAESSLDHRADFGIPLHEPWSDLADEVAEHVVRDDELPVHVRPCADAVDEHADPLAHKRCRLRGDGFEQNCKHTRALQRFRVAEQLL